MRRNRIFLFSDYFYFGAEHKRSLRSFWTERRYRNRMSPLFHSVSHSKADKSIDCTYWGFRGIIVRSLDDSTYTYKPVKKTIISNEKKKVTMVHGI